MPDERDLIGSADAERILNISRATLVRWVAASKLSTAGRLPGPRGAWVFHRDDVERLAIEMRRPA